MSVPNVQSPRGLFTGEAVSNVRICDEHFLLRVGLGGFPPTRPGQFVMLQCRPMTGQVVAREVEWPTDRPPSLSQPELANREPLLRRPLCLAGRWQARGGVELGIIYRTIGAGTRWLAGIKAGQQVSILGPLGNSFTIRPQKTLAALVGGGVGIPPMLYLAQALTETGKATVAFCGAKSKSLLPLEITDAARPCPAGRPTPCIRELAALCVDAAVATDDGTAGFRGLVSEAFTQWLSERQFAPEDLVVYCCGPEAMEKAVADICLKRDIECQLALERHMACGIGTCQSCVVKIRDAAERGWSYKLCCTDGPVFDAKEVLW